ncbi:anthranilate 1,2-dioxygenase ferredoxin subunit AndAb [Trinickia mobilis]|uniref:anthranilate 1,2-dioxygenase ferredoxin subunit AndAb n=1 Tax=Trinickia mobilis TaxID=2816356 RepID=UPI001A9049AF|nr:anthranilate 1,2-dioxygenase ferredoxin subunit AndAb [Trinickia mobilis]
MSTWHDIGALDDFVEDEPSAVSADGVSIAIFRMGDELFALHDLCTHETAPLSEGFVEDGCVECPLHQGLFDLRTGEARKAPCEKPVQTYPIRIAAGRVEVQVMPHIALAG